MKIPTQWTFDSADVAENFDAHVREQLPWYDFATGAVAHIAKHYVPTWGGLVYDVGAATGNVGRALAPMLDERGAEFLAIEPSQQMVAAYQGPGEVIENDAERMAWQPYDLAVSMLTLMFVPPAMLPALLHRLVAAIRPGGALVLVERMLPPAGYPSIVTSRLTMAAKAAAGADVRDIVAKDLSLSGVQRPLDPALLLRHGAVEWFRFGDFAGYLIEHREGL